MFEGCATDGAPLVPIAVVCNVCAQVVPCATDRVGAACTDMVALRLTSRYRERTAAARHRMPPLAVPLPLLVTEVGTLSPLPMRGFVVIVVVVIVVVPREAPVDKRPWARSSCIATRRRSSSLAPRITFEGVARGGAPDAFLLGVSAPELGLLGLTGQVRQVEPVELAPIGGALWGLSWCASSPKGSWKTHWRALEMG